MEEHKTIILHLLSQLKLGMDLTKVCHKTLVIAQMGHGPSKSMSQNFCHSSNLAWASQKLMIAVKILTKLHSVELVWLSE